MACKIVIFSILGAAAVITFLVLFSGTYIEWRRKKARRDFLKSVDRITDGFNERDLKRRAKSIVEGRNSVNNHVDDIGRSYDVDTSDSGGSGDSGSSSD